MTDDDAAHRPPRHAAAQEQPPSHDPNARERVGAAAAAQVEAMLRRARLNAARPNTARPSTSGALHELEHVHEPALRGAITMALRAALRVAVRGSWSRGWQPADLDRAARRASHRAPVVTALVEGIADELTTYARSTVDPRWWDQLAQISPAAPDDRENGAGPSPTGGGGTTNPVVAWREECTAILEATVLVERLPSLTILGSLPGERQHAADETAAVDDKILTKVRRLLAQAEGTPYEAEAETFTAAAQSLMARYRIDRAVLESSDPERADRQPEAIRLSVERPYESPKMQLLHQICLANRCTSVWSQAAGLATVIGFEGDRRAVELLYTSLLVQATTAMRHEGEQAGERARTRGFRSSFLLGYAVRVGQRLRDASQTQEAEVAAALAGGQWSGDARPGRPSDGDDSRPDLALVLSRRDDEVRSRTRDLFPHLQSTRRRQISDYGGFLQGRAAADRADLGTGGRLEGRAS